MAANKDDKLQISELNTSRTVAFIDGRSYRQLLLRVEIFATSPININHGFRQLGARKLMQIRSVTKSENISPVCSLLQDSGEPFLHTDPAKRDFGKMPHRVDRDFCCN
jgi:hypothetical protein